MAAQAGPEWVGDFISGSSYKTLTHEIIHGAFLSPFAGPWCPKYVSSLTHDKKHGFIALLICCVESITEGNRHCHLFPFYCKSL